MNFSIRLNDWWSDYGFIFGVEITGLFIETGSSIVKGLNSSGNWPLWFFLYVSISARVRESLNKKLKKTKLMITIDDLRISDEKYFYTKRLVGKSLSGIFW